MVIDGNDYHSKIFDSEFHEFLALLSLLFLEILIIGQSPQVFLLKGSSSSSPKNSKRGFFAPSTSTSSKNIFLGRTQTRSSFKLS
jgi:hypothetical protein